MNNFVIFFGEYEMKKKTILVCSALLALAGVMSPAEVKADDLPAGMASGNTVSITRKVWLFVKSC